MLSSGDIVEHKLTKDWLIVLETKDGGSKVLCRNKMYEEIWFNDFELTRK